MDEWISVKKRYPSSPGRYLVACIEGGKWQRVTIGDYGDGRFYSFQGRRAYWKITHWMYIPDPPKVEDDAYYAEKKAEDNNVDCGMVTNFRLLGDL